MRRLILLGRTLVPVLLLALLAIGTPVAQATTPDILITEVMAANTSTVADDQGSYSDWIELHNLTDTPIPLGGYTLTDDPTGPTKWPLFAATLAPGDFLVIWASGRDEVTPEGWHTSFRLSRGGEYVGLFDPDGQLVDEVAFGPQLADVSLGRLGTVFDRWVSFPRPTPGAANTTRHRLRAAPGAPPVAVTPGSGRYAGPVTVLLYTPVPGSGVYYTLDGSDPTVDGEAFTAPLEVTETTVLRAVALDDGVPVSAVTTATYLIGENTGLPVLSLVTEPAHLWDEETGIYTNAEERGRNWERPVTAEWLSSEGELDFSVGAGLRIHGGTSRGLAKQSFRLYFRGEYGPRELAYPLFGTEPGQRYDRLVLRSGSHDSWLWYGEEAVYLRDQLVRELHGAMGQVAARGRWVEVYLNGVYWGVYNLTERIDESFLATHFDHDDWDLVLTEEHGAWNAFVDWITGTDLSEAIQYEQAVQQLDIENFTSFVSLHLWAGNTDWASNNWYAARMRDGPDTRWRLFVWDAETTLGLGQEIDASEDVSFSQAVIYGGLDASLILASLLASPQYQAYFTAQVERHLAGALATETVRGRLAALVTKLRPAIAVEATRWLPDQEPAEAVAQWEAALQRVSDSLAANAQRLRQLSDPETLRPLLPVIPVPVSDELPPVSPLPPGIRIALLVHNPADLTPGDAAVVSHLATRGVTVNVIGTHEDSRHDPTQVAASHDLLLFSSSIRLLDTAVRYVRTTTPLIFWGPLLLEPTRLSHWGGTRSGGIWIRLVDPDHPIIAGLTAGLPPGRPLRVMRQPDTFSVSYKTIGPGVHVLARHLVGGDVALMVAEVGVELLNGQRARARTVFMFWHHDTFARATGDAIRLFDRSVDWALGLPSGSGPG